MAKRSLKDKFILAQLIPTPKTSLAMVFKYGQMAASMKVSGTETKRVVTADSYWLDRKSTRLNSSHRT